MEYWMQSEIVAQIKQKNETRQRLTTFNLMCEIPIAKSKLQEFDVPNESEQKVFY